MARRRHHWLRFCERGQPPLRRSLGLPLSRTALRETCRRCDFLRRDVLPAQKAGDRTTIRGRDAFAVVPHCSARIDGSQSLRFALRGSGESAEGDNSFARGLSHLCAGSTNSEERSVATGTRDPRGALPHRQTSNQKRSLLFLSSSFPSRARHCGLLLVPGMARIHAALADVHRCRDGQGF